MRIILITLTFFLCQFLIRAQQHAENEDLDAQISKFDVYFNMSDFLIDNVYDGKFQYLVVTDSTDYIVALLKHKVGKKKKVKYFQPWGIKYKGKKYFNTRYTQSAHVHIKHGQYNTVFVPFDITGDICAIVFDERYPNLRLPSYGVGLSGALTDVVVDNQLTWRYEDGRRAYILVINTQKKESSQRKDGNSVGRLVGRNDLRNMFANHPHLAHFFKEDKKSVTEVLEVIQTYNDYRKELKQNNE